MKVTTLETIEVEVEANITFEDICSEFGELVDAATPENYRGALSTIDFITRLMDRVPDEVIGRFKQEHRDIIHQRLTAQAERYTTSSLNHEETDSNRNHY